MKQAIISWVDGRHRKRAFIAQLPKGARLLDVGCGNNSPLLVKSIRPDIHYIGIDVGLYNQTDGSIAVAESIVLTEPSRFHSEILAFGDETFDAVLSSHNIEHCDYPALVLSAMCKILKPGGRLYLAFPCEASVRFPSRKGTLNFYDDLTHKSRPPLWNDVIGILKRDGIEVTFSSARYRPMLLALLGLIVEPYAAFHRIRIAGATWALYGFESIIWAVKRRRS